MGHNSLNIIQFYPWTQIGDQWSQATCFVRRSINDNKRATIVKTGEGVCGHCNGTGKNYVTTFLNCSGCGGSGHIKKWGWVKNNA